MKQFFVIFLAVFFGGMALRSLINMYLRNAPAFELADVWVQLGISVMLAVILPRIRKA